MVSVIVIREIALTPVNQANVTASLVIPLKVQETKNRRMLLHEVEYHTRATATRGLIGFIFRLIFLA